MDGMTPELETNRSKKQMWLLVVAGLVLLTALMAVSLPRTDTVTFRIVDAETGQPVRNVTAIRYGRTTGLPIEKLRIGLDPWKETTVSSSNGIFRMKGIPRRSSNSLTWILFGTSLKYYSTTFSIDDEGYLINASGMPVVHLARTNLVILPLYERTK
jgi:hypothetical protein